MTEDIFNEPGLKNLAQKFPQRFSHGEAADARYIDLRDLELPARPEIDLNKLNRLADIARGLLFAAVEAAQSGHPGGSSAKVEQLLTLLLGEILAFDAINPKNPGRDRLIWSAGHCTPLLHAVNALIYECLRRAGRQFAPAVVQPVFPEDLIRFRHTDGPQGHVESYYPLADACTGASGHGLSAAGGMAIAHKSCGLDTKIFVLMGDAESEEGMSYEARNVIAATGTDNIIVSLDYNHFGIDGPIEEATNSAYLNHWLGLGWNVIEVNGHNCLELFYAYRLATRGFNNSRPAAVIAHTIKGKHYGSKENSNVSHGTPAQYDEYVKIIRDLGFDIPGEKGAVIKDIETILQSLEAESEQYILTQLEKAAEKIQPESVLVEKMSTALPNRPLTNPVSLRRPEPLPPELIFEEGAMVATRKASAAWFKWMTQNSAFFYSGAGDLSGSILISAAENIYGVITAKNPYGRGIRFGIAEQNMAMMYAAMSQDVLPGGFQPATVFGTYAVFTTMIGNCVRMALIGNHLKPETKGFFIVLAAHDGPETGEDGPTHQGLYWMSLYSALPGIKVYKPFDANETVEMLFYALEKGDPIALSVMRPDTLVLKRGNGVPEAREATNGAYVYKKFTENGKTKTVLVISGVQILVNTLEILPEIEKDYDIKIIAVTSPQLFEDLRKNNPQKAQEILSDEERALVITLHNGWKGFLNNFILPADSAKKIIGIDTYLKSGNPQEVYEVAELTPTDIKNKILNALK